jgi:plastocyanin
VGTPRRFAVVALGAFLVALLVAVPAAAQVRTYLFRYGPIRMGGYQVRLPKEWVPTPKLTGFVTAMEAHLVYRNGRQVPIRRVMMHHIVFLDAGAPGARRHTSCAGRAGEPFYGTGEERERLVLPRGYGYHVGSRDRWRMQTMLMSHSLASQKIYVHYRVRIDTSRRLTPVTPLWLRANGCARSPSYTINGGGAPGSVAQRSFEWRMPISGRIVAAGGHLHGGAVDMWLSQPRCADRRLADTPPLYGLPNDPVYHVNPALHEPGPVATGYFLSQRGIPVRRGEPLKVTADYDGQWPHERVMAIMHVYVAHARGLDKVGCTALPRDIHTLWTRRVGVHAPPHFAVPLSALDSKGRPYVLARPAGPDSVFAGNATVDLWRSEFSRPNLSIPVGARIQWRFRDPFAHNVLLADGPRAVGSPSLSRGRTYSHRFWVPGTYRLFCYLHPVTMHEVVTVRPRDPAPSG